MSLVSANDLHLFPDPLLMTVASSYTTIDATGERVANVVQIATAGNISKLHVRTATVTTGDTLKVSLQGVATDGLPDGTILATATGNKAYGTVAVADDDDHVWKEVTLTEVAAVTQGQFISVVIEWSSYASGNLQIANSSCPRIFNSYLCTDITATPGTWIRAVLVNAIYCIALEYSGGVFHRNIDFGAGYSGTVNFNSGSAIDEIGNYVQFPVPFRAIGLWAWVEPDAAADYVLYDSSNNVLANCSPVSDIRYSTNVGMCYFLFDDNPASSVSIAKETWYRLAMKPTSDTNTIIYYFSLPNAAAMESFALGANCIYTARVNEGEWSETNTRRACLGLLADQLDNGVSSGGGRPEIRGNNL